MLDQAPQPEEQFEKAFEAARQQVVAALREREARVQAILDTTVDAIITIDELGAIESFNPAAEHMFGYPSAEVIGQNVRMLMPAPYREEHDGYLTHYRDTGEKRIIGSGREVVGQRKDGTTFPMDLTVSEVRFGDDRLFTGIVRDITERKQAEAALRDSDTRTQAILETTVDAIITIDELGHIEAFNLAAEQIFGYGAGEVIGQNVRILMPAPYREEHDGYLAYYRDTGEKRIIGIGREVIGQRKDGTTFPMDLAVGEVLLGDRRLFTGIVRDITERKQAEVALRDSEARYRNLIDHAPVIVLVLDDDGRIAHCNPYLETLSGYSLSDIQDKDWLTTLVPESDRERVRAEFRQALDDVRVRGYIIPLETRDGQTRQIEWHGATLKDADDSAIGVLGIGQDITERLRAETALRQTHENLEHRVQARTAALAAANEEVRRFAYIVSHDLRAPLINLKGFAGELRDLWALLSTVLPQLTPHLDEPQRAEVTRGLTQDGPEALGFIESSVTRMDGLIRGVLNLSRAGQREFDIEPVNTEALAQHIAQTLTHQLTQQGACIIIEPLATVNADHTAMEQILGNLLGNAVKYLDPDRPGEITIRSEHEADATRFQVSDNGRGIAEDDLPRVFELFRRVGRQDTQGEGMGLAYVQTLIRRHGGDITCQSTLGVGTTFSFTIAHHLVSGEPNAAA